MVWKKEDSWLTTLGDATEGRNNKKLSEELQKDPMLLSDSAKKQQINFESVRWKVRHKEKTQS